MTLSFISISLLEVILTSNDFFKLYSFKKLLISYLQTHWLTFDAEHQIIVFQFLVLIVLNLDYFCPMDFVRYIVPKSSFS